jgi:hypothetical protein
MYPDRYGSLNRNLIQKPRSRDRGILKQVQDLIRDDKKTEAMHDCHAESCAELDSVLFQHLIGV